MEFVISFPLNSLTLSILYIAMMIGVLASIGTYFLFTNKKISVKIDDKHYFIRMNDRFTAFPLFLILFFLQPIITMSLYALFQDYMLILEPLVLFSIILLLNALFKFKANLVFNFTTIVICSLAYQIFFRIGCFFSNVYIGTTYIFGNEVAVFFPVSWNEKGPYFPIVLIEIIFMLALYLFVIIKRLDNYNYHRPPFFYFIGGGLLAFALELFRSDGLTPLFWMINLKQIIYFFIALVTIILGIISYACIWETNASNYLSRCYYYMVRRLSNRISYKGDSQDLVLEQNKKEKEANNTKTQAISDAQKILNDILNSKEGEK